MSFSKCYYLRLAPVVTAKALRHAAYDATLAERRVKLWVGAYRPIRTKNTLYMDYVSALIRFLHLNFRHYRILCLQG